MKTLFDRFLEDESGAVTVDWVVITAAVVALGIGIFAVFESNVDDLAQQISGDLAGQLNSDTETAADP